jgi:hypothetical protein
LELILRLLFSGVIPAKAGIQYAAAVLGLLDRPPSRTMTRLVDSIRTKSALLAQHVSDPQDQVASKFVGGFSVRIFDPVVTSAISKLPILEFSISILNDFSVSLPADKIIQSFGFYRAARVNYHRTAVLNRAGANRFFNAIVHTGQCERLGIYLRMN